MSGSDSTDNPAPAGPPPCKHILVPGQAHCELCGEQILFTGLEPTADSKPSSTCKEIPMTRPKSNAALAAGVDHSEQLGIAASYVEHSMGRILMCVRTLKGSKFSESDEIMGLREALIQMLEEDVHNDLDVAREIFQTWKAQEVSHV